MNKSDVASFSQCYDAQSQSLLGTEEFILVDEIVISESNADVTVLVAFYLPVDTSILEPLEIGRILQCVSFHLILDPHEQFSLVHMDGDKGFNLCSDQIIGQFLLALSSELLHHELDFFPLLFELCNLVSSSLQ